MRVLVAHQHLGLVVVSDFSHSKRGVVVCHCYFNLQFPNDVWLRTCVHAQLCLTLCDPSDCSPPGSFVHGISQARVLEWVAISYSRGSFWPRHRTGISCTGRQIRYHWATWEAQPYRKHPDFREFPIFFFKVYQRQLNMVLNIWRYLCTICLNQY